MKKILFSGITAIMLCSTLAFAGDKKPAHKTSASCTCNCCACDKCDCNDCSTGNCKCTKCASDKQCHGATAKGKNCCAKK